MVIDKFLEAQRGQVWNFKTPGGPGWASLTLDIILKYDPAVKLLWYLTE